MAIRQTKTSGIDNLMQEMDVQAAGQQEADVTTEHIEALKQLNGTLAESIVELNDAKYRVDDAREVCESVYKRIWDIIEAIQTAMLRAENIRLKAHIDEKEFQRLAKLSDGILKVEEQQFNQHLEKQKELWRTTLAEQRHNLESTDGIWPSKKAFHTWLWFFLLPLCYTIISIAYYISVWFGCEDYTNDVWMAIFIAVPLFHSPIKVCKKAPVTRCSFAMLFDGY